MLADFCRRDPECVLTVYGGEALFCSHEIGKIMDIVKRSNFMIQANGIFLDHLLTEYVNRFHTILVSTDGDEALTALQRGWEGCT